MTTLVSDSRTGGPRDPKNGKWLFIALIAFVILQIILSLI